MLRSGNLVTASNKVLPVPVCVTHVYPLGPEIKVQAIAVIPLLETVEMLDSSDLTDLTVDVEIKVQ